jgi:hypothetical protein
MRTRTTLTAAALLAAGAALVAASGCNRTTTSTTSSTRATSTTPKTNLDNEPPRLVSAFYGLDALPKMAAQLYPDAPGKDGLPVTFSRRVMGGPDIDPKAFTVKTRSGALRKPIYATTRPADAVGKNHTVLLIGDLGSDPADPPISVEVTGDLPLEHGANGKGLSGSVIPLADGPALVLALGYKAGAFPGDIPSGARQVVVAIWAGGVTLKPGAEETAHLKGYRVTTSQGEVRPFALGDLNRNDNYVYLFLATDVPAERVTFAAGILVDPNGDVNPETSVAVSQAR